MLMRISRVWAPASDWEPKLTSQATMVKAHRAFGKVVVCGAVGACIERGGDARNAPQPR